MIQSETQFQNTEQVLEVHVWWGGVGWGGSRGWKRGLAVKSTGFSRGFSILFTIQNYPHDNSKLSITLVPGLRCSFLFSLDIKHVRMQKDKHVLLRSLIREKNGGRKIIPISIT